MSNTERSSSGVDPKLLEILVCPLTKSTLEYDAGRQELISREAKLVALFTKLWISNTGSPTLKISVVRIRERVVKFAAGRGVLDRSGFLVNNTFIQSGGGGDELDRRTRPDTATYGPVLIDDRQDLAGLSFKNNNRTGVATQRIDRHLADRRIFAFRLIVGDISHRLRAKATFKGYFAGDRLATGLFAATLLGDDRLAAFFFFPAALCGCFF